MRVLYITDALAVWGGIERVLRDKTSYLATHYGYDVHIVTTDQGNHSIPYPFGEGVKIHDLDIRYHRQYRFHGLARIIEYRKLNHLYLKRLKNTIEDIRPDIIVCIRIELIGIILKAKGNIPVVCESHSLCYAYKYENSSFLHRIRYHIALRKVRKVNCVVALTEGDARDWRRYNDNVVAIPNIVHLNDIGKYSSLKSKIVIFVGRFSIQKDIWSLLEIWKIVNQKHPDWELHMYGEGELKEEFENSVLKTNANIKVFHPTAQIFDRYLESTILIMTSLYEPFGLVLPEAMSFGLPVIAFDCPYGPADIIKDNLGGYLVRNRDITSFVEKLTLLMDDEELRIEKSMQAIKSSSKYKAEYIMQQWNQLFNIISDSNES